MLILELYSRNTPISLSVLKCLSLEMKCCKDIKIGLSLGHASIFYWAFHLLKLLCLIFRNFLLMDFIADFDTQKVDYAICLQYFDSKLINCFLI